MALERFIPKSPDPFIRNSQDFEVAKFGHLNTIIEYINSYVVTDSLQLAGSGPITSTARYITDSLGNASAISISTIGVGIGTDAPTSLLDVVRYTTGSVNNNYQFRILNSADGLYPYSVLLLEHNNRTGIGNQGGASIIIKDGFANVSRASIGFDYFNSGSYSSAGGNLRLSNDGQGNLLLSTAGVDALRIFKDQGVQIGGVSTNLSSIARLLVKGTGSTSATTSLLVQNSGGTDLLKIRDDGFTTIGAGNQGIISANATFSSYIVSNGTSGNVFGTFTSFISSAIVQCDSTSRGFLPPRMTTTQRDAIATPATGLKVYNTTTNTTDTYDGTTWQRFGQQTFIKGSGSTSATTSLLVQNSAGAERLRVYDDGTIFMGNTNPGIYTTFGYSGRIGNNNFECPGGIFRYGGGQLTFYGTNNNANAFSFSHNNVQGSLSTGISMINLGGTYQTQQSFEFANLRIAATYDFHVNTTTNAIARGIYYNPTITNLRVAQHYAWQNTSGAMIVNSSTPNASAILQADSTTQGFLPPRMTTAQKNAIATPAAGLVVYDTDLNKLCVYTTAWQTITSV